MISYPEGPFTKKQVVGCVSSIHVGIVHLISWSINSVYIGDVTWPVRPDQFQTIFLAFIYLWQIKDIT